MFIFITSLYKKKLKINSTLQDLTQWYGDNGKTFFYQSELPYDTSEASFGQENYTGYRVDVRSINLPILFFPRRLTRYICFWWLWILGEIDSLIQNLVKSHSGYGIGVYSFFAYYHVTIKSGIVAPENVTFHNPLSVFLDGFGTIEHVLNGHGNPTGYTSDQTSFYCDWIRCPHHHAEDRKKQEQDFFYFVINMWIEGKRWTGPCMH